MAVGDAVIGNQPLYDRGEARRLSGMRISVIGGGIIGLSVAWRLAEAGARISLWRDGALCGTASEAAGGMLSVSAETVGETEAFLTLCRESQRRWPGFARALESLSGRSIDFAECGTLLVATCDEERRQLEGAQGVAALSPDEWRRLEPALSDEIVAAGLARADGRVDNRLALAALQTVCARMGVVFCGPAERIVLGCGRTVGVSGDGPSQADLVVLAAGAWTDAVLERSGLEVARTGIVPVKGEMLALQLELSRRLLSHVVRAPGLYLVPRASGRLVIGATSELAGFDARVTPKAVQGLLARAGCLVPALQGLVPAETWAGLRPLSPTHHPIIAAEPAPGLVIAGGHYRNGILLAPLTADLVAGAIAGTLTIQERELVSPFMGIDAGSQVRKLNPRPV